MANPLLAPLGNYGGLTQTMPPLPGSPAIDAGGDGAAATDQRGQGRFGIPDIGAYESHGFAFVTAPGNGTQTSPIGTAFALTVVVTANDPVEPVDGGVVQFTANPAANGATAIFYDLAPSAVVAGDKATLVAAPNNVLGSYTVVATCLTHSASFALTNGGNVLSPLVVNTTSDSIAPGAGLLSLREAVAFADTAPAKNTVITFDPAVFATPRTITLAGAPFELTPASGTVTIAGPATGVTINAGGLSRVFTVDAGVTASLSNLTLTGGNGGGLHNYGSTTLSSCAVSSNAARGVVNFSGATITLTSCTVSGNAGGGLSNFSGATMTLTGCTVSGNTAPGGGGGLANGGTLTMANCTISGNKTTGFDAAGAGLVNSGAATLTNCTISGNSADGYTFGGGVSQGAAAGTNPGNKLTLISCTISGNSATFGGGLLIKGATLTNCVISNNTANAGGGLYGGGTLTNCTIAGNTAILGGGLFGGGTLTNCTISNNSAQIGGGADLARSPSTLTNTIVAGQKAGGDVSGKASGSNNLIGTGGSGGLVNGVNGNIVGVANPLLAPLGNYGGPTQTMPLLPGSPAIDAGISGTGIPTTDQRGSGRVGAVDIGAFESSGFTLAVTSGSGQATLVSTAFSAPLVVTVTAKNPTEPVAGGLILFTAPPSGMLAILIGDPATIGPTGTASVTASANGTVGSYTVSATASGITKSVSFSLTNLATVAGTRIDDGNAQRSMVRSITLTFSSSIASTLSTVLANLSLTRTSDNLLVGLTGTLDSSGTVLTLMFTGSSIIGGSLADGRYTLSYAGTTVLNSTQLWRLFGDLYGTATVNAADWAAFTKAMNSRKGMNNYSAYLDYNADGLIIITDQTAFMQRYGNGGGSPLK